MQECRGYVATLILPHYEDPPNSTGDGANVPTCGPLLILFPALKRRGPSRRHGLCNECAHLWAAADFVPRFEVLGTPKTVGVR